MLRCTPKAVMADMGTTTTTSIVHGTCTRFNRNLQETRAIFFLSVAATILLSFINAGLVYDNVIPTEPDYNREHFLGIVSMSANSIVNAPVSVSGQSERILPLSLKNESSATSSVVDLSKLPDWKTNMSRNILFVHVGKAGGETIKSILSAGCLSRQNPRRKEKCLRKLPNSTISDTIQSYFHCSSMTHGAADYSTSYLYNLRHPLDRAVSWYRYVTPENCRKDAPQSANCRTAWAINKKPHDGWEAEFFGRCFPTIEDWAQALATPIPTATTTSSLPMDLSDSSTSNNTDCSELAWSSIAGKVDLKAHGVDAHMVFNFRYYTDKTIARFPSKEVLVVRMKELWQDLGDLDRLLGGDGTFGHLHGSSVTHGSQHHKYHRSISESSAKLLCCALQDEMRIYRDLMNRATNLDKETKLESSLQTVTRCGAESWEDLQKECESLVSPSRVTG
jgi:hypothetical protein